ncbi:hypothetical protein [Methylobacterium sp. GC_Met_2]|uniref:hypothetical protein n=1 Tax=Methylobacterium sp. GC_Met_2 TaxID=2937376 RepID=UPI00226B5B8E|nr:hypothetical protein [Methylobacterium sp. GC_Met_2]
MDIDLFIRRDGESEGIPLHYGPVRVDPDGTVSRVLAQPSFPLDAEQIVRLTGAVLTRVLNAIRHPDAKRACEGGVTLAIADSTGVALPVESGPHGYRRLLPYGSESITLPEGRRLPGSILSERGPDTLPARDASYASPRQAQEGRGEGDA